MKLNGILLPEFADDLLGDESSRVALERAAHPLPEVKFAVPDTTGGDCSGLLDAIEESELTELLCGFAHIDTGGVVKTATSVMLKLKGQTVTLPRGLATRFDCGFVGKLPERWYKSDVSKATRSFLNAALDDNTSATELARLQALANAS